MDLLLGVAAAVHPGEQKHGKCAHEEIGRRCKRQPGATHSAGPTQQRDLSDSLTHVTRPMREARPSAGPENEPGSCLSKGRPASKETKRKYYASSDRYRL